ncbi:MAG: DUF3726 domain-containing protein [Pseudomonadota bacterium]
MSYSLSEIEALALKAARGAGYSWGLSYEVGRAVTWLIQADLDGCAILGHVLEWVSSSSVETAHCPIKTGVSLSDDAYCLNSDVRTFQNVYEPAMLLPFASFAAKQLNCAVKLELDTVPFTISPTGYEGQPSFKATAQSVHLQKTADPLRQHNRINRYSGSPDTIEILQGFAARTYAPATEASRRLGAGGTTSDND